MYRENSTETRFFFIKCLYNTIYHETEIYNTVFTHLIIQNLISFTMFTEANKYLQFLPVLHFQLTRSFLFTSEVAFGTLSVSVLSLFVYLIRPDDWNRRRKTKHKVKEDSCGMHRKCCIYQNTFIGSRASKFRWYGIRF